MLVNSCHGFFCLDFIFAFWIYILVFVSKDMHMSTSAREGQMQQTPLELELQAVWGKQPGLRAGTWTQVFWKSNAHSLRLRYPCNSCFLLVKTKMPLIVAAYMATQNEHFKVQLLLEINKETEREKCAPLIPTHCVLPSSVARPGIHMRCWGLACRLQPYSV